MGKKKKYLIKSVNFGDEKEPARILIEKYLESSIPKHKDKSVTTSRDKAKPRREQELSNLMRKLVVIYFSHLKQFEDYKKDALIFERKELIKKRAEISKALTENSSDLENFGIDVGKIDF